MALEDIIEKIRTDAAATARSILDESETRARELISRAQAQADEESRVKLEAAHERALSDAETIRVNGRLEVNKVMLAARRELIDETYSALIDSIAELPREKYAALLAREVVRSAHEGERWTLGTTDVADTALVDAVVRAIEETLRSQGRSYSLYYDANLSAPFTHGAYVKGDRTEVELSPESIVNAHKRALEPLFARRLFEDTRR